MLSHLSWIRAVSLSCTALALGVGACSSPTDGGHSDSGTPDAATGDDGGSAEAATSDAPAETGADAGGFLKVCTVLGTPGDCPPGEMLTCRSYPNPAPGKDLCTHACTTAADCPAPSKGCGGSGFCAGP